MDDTIPARQHPAASARRKLGRKRRLALQVAVPPPTNQSFLLLPLFSLLLLLVLRPIISIFMVHRPADSRLLSNLLSHEKDYAKALVSFLDTADSSLGSFSAYAAASSPPSSHAIIAVASSFAGANDALRKYSESVDLWRDQLKKLQELEDEVGNIMRDREIL